MWALEKLSAPAELVGGRDKQHRLTDSAIGERHQGLSPDRPAAAVSARKVTIDDRIEHEVRQSETERREGDPYRDQDLVGDDRRMYSDDHG
jgi:hypothetical protein